MSKDSTEKGFPLSLKLFKNKQVLPEFKPLRGSRKAALKKKTKQKKT